MLRLSLVSAFAFAFGAGVALADAPPSAPIFYCPILKQLACPTPAAGFGAGATATHRTAHKRMTIAHAVRRRHVAHATAEAEVSSSQAWMYRYELTHKGFASTTTERVEAAPPPPPPLSQHIEEGQSWDATMLGHGATLFEETETERTSRHTFRRSSSSSAAYGTQVVGVMRARSGRMVYTYSGRDDFGYLVWPGKTMNLPGR